MIRRDLLLEKLIDYKDKDIVKIITGIRRCGKSYLLFSIYYQYLLNHGVDKNHIILINLESKKNESLRDSDALYKYVQSNIKDDEKYYIFIDEIQTIDDFEDVVNGIKTDFNSDLYITGSNSKLLSSDINTKLRGRGLKSPYTLYLLKNFTKIVAERNKRHLTNISSMVGCHISPL